MLRHASSVLWGPASTRGTHTCVQDFLKLRDLLKKREALTCEVPHCLSTAPDQTMGDKTTP